MAFRAKLRSRAAGIAGSEEADDIIHDAFCRLWSRHPIIEDETEALKLSYTAVRNSAIDSYRRSTSRPTVTIEDSCHIIEQEEETETAKERQQTYETVVSLSRRVLNKRQFEVFELHDIKGLGYEEVAETLGMTQENVRVTLSRARKSIREIYRKTQTV